MLALGTQDGVWIGSEHDLDTIDSTHGDLKQIMPVQACHRLALINGMLIAMAYNPKHKYSLVAYPLLGKKNDSTGDTLIQHGRKSKESTKKTWCVVKRDWVISMAVGRLYQQVVMVYLTRYGNHILAVVAIPRTQTPYFKKVKVKGKYGMNQLMATDFSGSWGLGIHRAPEGCQQHIRL